MKKGILHYNFLTDEYEIVFGDNGCNHRITTQDCFEVLKGSKWLETCLKYNERYYYTNDEIQPFEGQIVRI